MSTDELPVILVAAKDTNASNKIISELIEKDVGAESDSPCVWELSNKYYTAVVRLQAVGDAGPAPHVPLVEAHVVHLAQDECNAETLERRARRASGAGGAADGVGVRLALADCPADREPEALVAAALRLNYELLPLRPEAGRGEGEGDEEEGAGATGWARAREALQAHVWPGLQLAAHVSPLTGWAGAGAESRSSSSCGDSEAEPEPNEEECVRRAELFADALAAVEGVRGAAGGGGVEGGERLLRAEQLVHAFCRALGTDFHTL